MKDLLRGPRVPHEKCPNSDAGDGVKCKNYQREGKSGGVGVEQGLPQCVDGVPGGDERA